MLDTCILLLLPTQQPYKMEAPQVWNARNVQKLGNTWNTTIVRLSHDQWSMVAEKQGHVIGQISLRQHYQRSEFVS